MTPGVSFDATMAAMDDIDAAIMLKGVICATRSKSCAMTFDDVHGYGGIP